MTTSVCNLLLFLLCVAAYSCNKPAEESKPAPVTTTPINSGTPANKNSVDSIVGTYYGLCTCYGNTNSNGTKHFFGYTGNDTLLVTTGGAGSFMIQSNHLTKSDAFVFDSMGTMYGANSNFSTRSELHYYPAKDSLRYTFSYSGPDEGTECSFIGVK